MISTTLTKIELNSDLVVIVCLPWVPWEEGLSYVAGAMHNQMPIHDDCHRLYRQHPNVLYKCRLNICTLVECNFLGPLTAGSYWFGIRTCLLPCIQMQYFSLLTHWGRVTHICVGKTTSLGSDNGLSPLRRQAIIWTNADLLSIGPLGIYFSEIWIEI